MTLSAGNFAKLRSRLLELASEREWPSIRLDEEGCIAPAGKATWLTVARVCYVHTMRECIAKLEALPPVVKAKAKVVP